MTSAAPQIVDKSTGELLPAVASGFGSSSALEQAAIAEVQVGAMIALRNPRNEDQARDAILRACKRVRFAEKARYSIQNRGQGFTIRFAEEAVRLWGNIKFQRFIISNDDNEIVCKVTGWDLQTGTSYSEDVMVKKRVERKAAQGREVVGQRTTSAGTIVFICVSSDDELLTLTRSMCARAERNIGLKLIPADFREEAHDEIKKTLAEGVKADPEGEKRKVMDGFSSIGVRPIALQAYLGHPLDTITTAEIVDLRGLYAAIKAGEFTWQDVMDRKEAADTDEGGGAKTPPKQRRAPVVAAAGRGAVRPPDDKDRDALTLAISGLADKIAIRRFFLEPTDERQINNKAAEVYSEFIASVGLTLNDPIGVEPMQEIKRLMEQELTAE